MRIGYTDEEDEEDYPGQLDLWQGNCTRSIRGKIGQRELRELRDALLALPEKRLIHAKRKGIDLADFDPEEESDEVGIEAGMPRLVAWKVVEVNDVELSHVTEESRYVRMLKWVESQLEKSQK